MSDKPETIHDIIADILAQNQGLPEDAYAISPLVCDMLHLADRLEAAYKREIYPEVPKCEPNWEAICARCRDGESPKDCRYYGEPDGCGADGHYPMTQIGNAQKMREAVKAVVDVGYPHNFQREAPHIRGYCYDITRAIKKCFAALSAPPRNFDRFGGDIARLREEGGAK